MRTCSWESECWRGDGGKFVWPSDRGCPESGTRLQVRSAPQTVRPTAPRRHPPLRYEGKSTRESGVTDASMENVPTYLIGDFTAERQAIIREEDEQALISARDAQTNTIEIEGKSHGSVTSHQTLRPSAPI